MEPHEQIGKQHARDEQGKRVSSKKFIINVIIVSLLTIGGYFCYAIVSGRNAANESEKAALRSERVIQLDVLNGCGARGISAKFTNYLRSHGFDVVEMKNYKTFSIPRTLVIDRIGDLKAARYVATALGVSEEHIIQQINPDYFVDVSVIIGADYPALHTSN